MGISARECALKILYQTDQGAYSDAALKEGIAQITLSEDKGLITELVYGVIGNKSRLDFIIASYSKLPLKKLSKWIINILRMGIYQMIFLDKIPESAAVNESVKLAKRYGHAASAGFVNGVLRNVAKNGAPECEDLATCYSHPEWIVKMWEKRYGKEFTKELLAANNQKASITIRVNTLKTNIEELKVWLEEKGIQAKIIDDICLEVKGIGNVEALEAYQKGLFIVQDMASMAAVEALGPKPGEMILDVCAAPGGKTTYIAQRMENQGEVIAFDLHAHKVEIINKNAQRMGISIIEAQEQNAENIREELIKKADRVLVDVPCSGLGIIRKKPDIKWTKTLQDIDELSKVQQRILQTASSYVRKGGRLVYATCTISEKENEVQLDQFLKKNANFKLEEKRQLFPHTDHCDGFFIGVLTCVE